MDGFFKLNKSITTVPETPEFQIKKTKSIDQAKKTIPTEQIKSSKCLNFNPDNRTEPPKKLLSLKRKKVTKPNNSKKKPITVSEIEPGSAAILEGYEQILNLDPDKSNKVEEALLQQLKTDDETPVVDESLSNAGNRGAKVVDKPQGGPLLVGGELSTSTPSFDSDFGSDLDDEVLNSLMDQATEDMAKLSRYQRLKVELVVCQSYTKEVVCQVVDTKTTDTDRQITLKLSGEWFFTKVEEGDTLHLSTDQTGDVVSLSNDSSNLLVTHPDILISPTTISSSIRCLRQAVLGEVYRPTVGFSSNEVMLLGTITHSVFDKALSGKDFSVQYLTTSLSEIVEQSEIVESLSCVELNQQQVLEKLSPSIKLMSDWGAKFFTSRAGVDYGGQLGQETIGISQVVDIEENIWSPKYGCKGKVDATVRIHTGARGDRLTPLELKSGASRNNLGSVDHRAQLILYTMMMEERYKEKVDSGILYYVKGQQTIGVPSSNVERRALLMKRNEIAAALKVVLKDGEVKFPPLINNKMTCKYCNHQQSCTQVYKTFDTYHNNNTGNHNNNTGNGKVHNGISNNHGNDTGNNNNGVSGNHGNDTSSNHGNYAPVPGIYEQHGAHLTQAHIDYFRNYCTLSVKEAQKSMQEVRMPWKSSRLEGLTLTGVSSDHGYTHKFKLTQDSVHKSVSKMISEVHFKWSI